MKLDFPKNYEWILNFYKEMYVGGKMKKSDGYEFEIWEYGFPNITIARFKTKTAKQMADKIKKLLLKLNK